MQFTREENPNFPRFSLPVLSPAEALCRALGSDTKRGSVVPVAAALLAYLANSDGRGGAGGGERDALNVAAAIAGVDGLLCGLIRSMNLSELLDWRLGPFLSGKV